ncbi:hypothetical protein BpHYR1_033266 [Brachionus plicatilis]|uniref:Uncharacterized protein n=1 Tax=Brachionus plicatilis TaxID=10195 RepID=A0A3M7QJ30_BRAPC|nr:hypothetical protein BpHYR1_033266 [Brachionus plicatilis]
MICLIYNKNMFRTPMLRSVAYLRFRGSTIKRIVCCWTFRSSLFNEIWLLKRVEKKDKKYDGLIFKIMGLKEQKLFKGFGIYGTLDS